MPKTYWNGEPAKAERVLVQVKKPDHLPPDTPPMAWYLDVLDTQRRAVRIHYGPHVFYIDDDDLPPGHADRMAARLAELPADEQTRLKRLMAAFPQNEPGAGHGWAKVTKGKGSPMWSHRSLPVAFVWKVLS